ncbi:MAG TPA: ATP-binding protein [Candidatus Krumholzibacteria bacterium]|nr:ATP-binding protein [Candidatus Krumholzibacteria bacterium]
MRIAAYIPRRRFLLAIAALAGMFAVLAELLPWWVLVPLAVTIATAYASRESIWVRDRYERVLESIRKVHGDAIGELTHVRPGDVDAAVYKALKEIATELERKNFQLVEKNIQLLSIKEIGLTLVSSLDESKVVDAVINFLSKGLGYRELFVGIFNADDEAFNLYVFRDTPEGHVHSQLHVKLEALDGLLRKSVQMHQSVLIRDPEMHPVGNPGGAPLFRDSTMSSYLIVPLVKSGATQGCETRENCVLHMTQVKREAVSMEHGFRCAACDRIPVLGVVGVTDGFKAASLSRVDLVSVETLAVQLSTMLENNRLFAELQQEESFRDNVINSMMNGLITVDERGRVLFANALAEEITGYNQAELRQLRAQDLFVDSPTGTGENPIIRTVRTGRRGYQQEAWLIKKDGGKDPVVLNTMLLLDERKEPQGALAVFNDITRQKRMEEQITHLDKLAALGRLSSSIAHEIRNPLTGIAAGIQYLQRAGQVADSQRDNIEFILEEVKRIDRLIGDLMSVVRVSDLIYQETTMEDLIQSSIASMADLAKRKLVTMKTEFPPQPRTVVVDADRMTQVMINLLKNAIEASPADSSVTVALSFSHDASDVVFDAVGDFAIIRVRDNGLGLTEEDRQRVFEPFFSKKTGGTGLGLYVTHSIIERHGGYIAVDSEYGVGTTFAVYLPVKQVHHGDSREVGHPVSG